LLLDYVANTERRYFSNIAVQMDYVSDSANRYFSNIAVQIDWHELEGGSFTLVQMDI